MRTLLGRFSGVRFGAVVAGGAGRSVSGENLLLACGLLAMSSCNMKGHLVSPSSYRTVVPSVGP